MKTGAKELRVTLSSAGALSFEELEVFTVAELRGIIKALEICMNLKKVGVTGNISIKPTNPEV